MLEKSGRKNDNERVVGENITWWSALADVKRKYSESF